MKKSERIKMVKAKEFIARQINDETIFDSWLYAADVVPVRHGRWKKELAYEDELGNTYYWDVCSLCDTPYPSETPYCPNCGAKMEKYNDI